MDEDTMAEEVEGLALITRVLFSLSLSLSVCVSFTCRLLFFPAPLQVQRRLLLEGAFTT